MSQTTTLQQRLNRLCFWHVLLGLFMIGLAIVMLLLLVWLSIAIRKLDPAHGDFHNPALTWFHVGVLLAFVVGGLLGVVLPGLHGLLTIHAGFCLRAGKYHRYCRYLSIVQCANAPIGTPLGIATLSELAKPETREYFGLPAIDPDAGTPPPRRVRPASRPEESA